MIQLVPINCLHKDNFDHLDALLLESLLPIALLVIAKATTTARRMRAPGSEPQQVLSIWLTLLFLILPVRFQFNVLSRPNSSNFNL